MTMIMILITWHHECRLSKGFVETQSFMGPTQPDATTALTGVNQTFMNYDKLLDYVSRIVEIINSMTFSLKSKMRHGRVGTGHELLLMS